MIRIVRKFCFTKTIDAKVLFSVDIDGIILHVFAKLLIDERIETGDVRVRFLDMDDNSIIIEPLSRQ